MSTNTILAQCYADTDLLVARLARCRYDVDVSAIEHAVARAQSQLAERVWRGDVVVEPRACGVAESIRGMVFVRARLYVDHEVRRRAQSRAAYTWLTGRYEGDEPAAPSIEDADADPTPIQEIAARISDVVDGLPDLPRRMLETAAAVGSPGAAARTLGVGKSTGQGAFDRGVALVLDACGFPNTLLALRASAASARRRQVRQSRQRTVRRTPQRTRATA